MSVKAPVPRLYWALSLLLCLCTLVALWITAWKIRQDKVEARRGGREPEPSETDRVLRVPIAKDKLVRAGHFKLAFTRSEELRVFDLASKPLVTFTGFVPGERRGFQELRIRCLAADERTVLAEVEFRPGAPCLGPGQYADLKPGLRIELNDDTHLTVLRWDSSKPEIYLAGPSGEAGMAEGGSYTFPPYRARLAERILHVERN